MGVPEISGTVENLYLDVVLFTQDNIRFNLPCAGKGIGYYHPVPGFQKRINHVKAPCVRIMQFVPLKLIDAMLISEKLISFDKRETFQ